MREQYLKNMGIQPWFLRTKTVAPSVACYVLQLKKDGRFFGILLAESEKKSKAVSKMLWDICCALKLEASGEWCSEIPKLSELVEQSQFVITMGEFPNTFKNVQRIKTVSPQRLLSEPQLKREAWNALQKVSALKEKAMG